MKVKEVIAHAKAIQQYCKTKKYCQLCPFFGERTGCIFMFSTPDALTFNGIMEKKVKRND